MPRVLLAGFMHETNTFSVLPTGMAAYEARAFYQGAEISRKLAGTQTEVGAVLGYAKDHGWELTHPVYANATPSGRVARAVHDRVTDLIVERVKADDPFDGVFLSLHGAMACEHDEDGEGRLLQSIRDAAGPDIPIAVTLDLHANVTDRMAALANIMISYRTYPHVDQVAIASQACELLDKSMKGEIVCNTVVRRGQMLDGADHGRTTSPGPMTEVLASADKLHAQTPGVLAVSVNAGFPWADIHDAGPTAVVTGTADAAAMGGLAETLIREIWEKRHRITIDLKTCAEAMARCERLGPQKAPVVMGDYADNPGGGGYGDGTRLLSAMLEAGLRNAAFGPLYDPDAVQECMRVGLGSTLTLDVGGKVGGAPYGGPVRVTGNVTAVTNGSLVLEGPMTKGARIEMGPTVVLDAAGANGGNVEIVINSRRYQNYDQMYFKHVGIEPKKRAYLGVKSAHHFRAAYGPIASEIIVVDDGGGVTSRNYKSLTYAAVRRPIYPLDLD